MDHSRRVKWLSEINMDDGAFYHLIHRFEVDTLGQAQIDHDAEAELKDC